MFHCLYIYSFLSCFSRYFIALVVHIIRVFIVWPLDSFLDTLQAYFSDEKEPSMSWYQSKISLSPRINTHLDRYLSGNYAPVSKEITKWDLPITEGAIPTDLAGEFVRNGPNPVYVVND